MKFVYCVDENFNFQLATSIFSLLNNVNREITIYVLHENPDTFNNFNSHAYIKLYRISVQSSNVNILNNVKLVSWSEPYGSGELIGALYACLWYSSRISISCALELLSVFGSSKLVFSNECLLIFEMLLVQLYHQLVF